MVGLMGDGSAVKMASWTMEQAQTAEAPSPECLRDAAARLLDKLHSIQHSLARIDTSPNAVLLEKATLPTERDPGLIALLEECHARATALDRLANALADRIGQL